MKYLYMAILAMAVGIGAGCSKQEVEDYHGVPTPGVQTCKDIYKQPINISRCEQDVNAGQNG